LIVLSGIYLKLERPDAILDAASGGATKAGIELFESSLAAFLQYLLKISQFHCKTKLSLSYLGRNA
jgi:hypothetical protein